MDDRMTDGSRVSYDHAFVGSSYVGIGCEYCGEQRQTHLKHVADYDQLRADKAALEAQLAQSEARLNSCLEEADVRCKGSIDTCPHCRYLREKLASWPRQYDQQVADCKEHRRNADAELTAQVETLTADNAALRVILAKVSQFTRYTWSGHGDDAYIVPTSWIAAARAMIGSAHPGAALLEEMAGLRARVVALEAVAEAAEELIDDRDVCGCTGGCGRYFGKVEEHPVASKHLFDALDAALRALGQEGEG